MWFRRSPVKINKTDQGFHGKHWYGVFHIDTDESVLMNTLHTAVDTGDHKIIDRKTILIEDPLIRALAQGDTLVTGFPRWKGTVYEQVKTIAITEWTHTNCLEAIIQVEHPSGCGIKFFAVDYAFNKKCYLQKNIEVNIVGFAYCLREIDIEEVNKNETRAQFSEDFCGYFPGDEPDEIHFISRINNFYEHTLGNIRGYIVNVSLTPAYMIDFFIAQENLTIELANNKHIEGVLWLIGTLE